jgi:predicted RNA-binding Zn ribbon-like protein
MAPAYQGPVRDEVLAIELHNTLYASQGVVLDGLGHPGSAAAWLKAVGDRLPAGGTGAGPTPEELTALRDVVRDVLHAAIDDRAPSRASVAALNRASARAPHSRAARWRRGAQPLATVRFHSARRADIVISAIAADAIDLVSGPGRNELRLCGAPGCVLIFQRDHPRRAWCSAACGNRARQARHYRRTRAPSTGD